ncbi:MAG TPA: hypothetical protein VFQ79_06965 [Bryobacteraceae bacterium]|nr:hypothetical protein [Bryobacteraceae bacterium]
MPAPEELAYGNVLQLAGAVVLFCWTAAFAAGQNVLHVPAGGNLQQAIDAALPGDTIAIKPGENLPVINTKSVGKLPVAILSSAT